MTNVPQLTFLQKTPLLGDESILEQALVGQEVHQLLVGCFDTHKVDEPLQAEHCRLPSINVRESDVAFTPSRNMSFWIAGSALVPDSILFLDELLNS